MGERLSNYDTSTTPRTVQEAFDVIKTDRDKAREEGFTFHAAGMSAALRLLCPVLDGDHVWGEWSVWIGNPKWRLRQCSRCDAKQDQIGDRDVIRG